ncbi:hypothetical protein HF329_06350 [Chitinophaga oryzae]|uniref:Uncharacterized protein n=1 Tax=Chitinophaga oryzae TaxID=2725414 RepID=A0AAE7D5R9_9BACT|nr:hypothetical protein [Chitinophaga oryzae]QJB30943.1 hypothetical protein HF329_06350 [Chitinophaga oryzae]
MLDPNHPNTPFIFQAAAHPDQLRLYWKHRATMREEALEQSLRTVVEALETLTRSRFAKNETAVAGKLEAIVQLFDDKEAGDSGFYDLLGQLEHDLGTWAI